MVQTILSGDGFSLWARRVLALCGIGLFLIVVLCFAQRRSFRVFVNGGIPATELGTLYDLWIMTNSAIPSSEGTHLSISTTHESDEELSRQPVSLAEMVVCSGRNRMAVGLVRRECRTHGNGWSCTYRGAPVVLLSYWSMAGVPGVIGLLAVLAILFRRRILSLKVDARACQNCGYLLIGLTSERCPECGTPFVNATKNGKSQGKKRAREEKVSGRIV